MLISLTGIDGAGKSLIAKELEKELIKDNINCVLINMWDVLNEKSFPECRFINKDLDNLRNCISEMEGHSRFIFLMWMIYNTIEKEFSVNDDII